jgi:hypothetical protein
MLRSFEVDMSDIIEFDELNHVQFVVICNDIYGWPCNDQNPLENSMIKYLVSRVDILEIVANHHTMRSNIEIVSNDYKFPRNSETVTEEVRLSELIRKSEKLKKMIDEKKICQIL